jgi:hypothetical protein
MAHTDPTLTGEDALGPHGKVNHETTDIPLGGTTRVALFSAGAIGVVFLLMWGAWGFFLKQAQATDPGKPAMASPDFGTRLPATPRVQSLPSDDLNAYRAAQNAKINGLAWVDQGAGTVRIPINAAMRLIVERADAFGDPNAKVPPDHSWAFPGAAQTERAAEAAPAAPAAAPAPGHEHTPAPAATPAPPHH